MEYYLWGTSSREKYAWLDINEPEPIKKIWYKIHRGYPVKDIYPLQEEVIWDLDPQKGKLVGAFVPNANGLKVVNTAFKEVLEKESGATFEFLPLKIRDHRKRIVPETYWFANLLDLVHCLDVKRSDFDWCPMEETQVRRFCRCVLDQSKIPEGKKLFRLGERKVDWIIEEELVFKIAYEYALGGAGYEKLKNYGSEFRCPYSYVPDPELGY
ncbi:hypothetical protein CHISP_2959 [Chitinispirillum alkaliphilum]|nr:hypothetical protein CHISP_2959 [Chitinispirillum alkaliphilum]